MKYAIIIDGKVSNVALSEAALEPNWIACGDTVQIGDAWDGQSFLPAPPVVQVPQSVTMRQARLALLGAGKLAAVEVAIEALPSPQKEAAWIEWEYAATVERNSPLIQQLAPALGLTEAEMDALFLQAASL